MKSEKVSCPQFHSRFFCVNFAIQNILMCGDERTRKFVVGTCVYIVVGYSQNSFRKMIDAGQWIAVHRNSSSSTWESTTWMYTHNQSLKIVMTICWQNVHLHPHTHKETEKVSIWWWIGFKLCVFFFLSVYVLLLLGFLVFNFQRTQKLTFPHCLLFIHLHLIRFVSIIRFSFCHTKLIENLKKKIECYLLMLFVCLSHMYTSSNNPL